MKTLYLDCSMGAAGDMLTAALLELLPDQDQYLEKLNHLGIPGVTFTREPSVKCGITGTHMTVKVDGEEESEEMHDHHDHEHDHDHEHHHHHHDHDHEHHHHDHDHEHEHHHDHDHDHDHEHHDHHHGHHHSSMSDIEAIVGALPLSERVRGNILRVYQTIAEAESHVHGVPVTEIHFHEVGTMDAIADIAAVCYLMDEINPEQVIVSPVHVGSGQVRCAHGILPVPAPATAYILQDVPIYGGRIRGELCTPTGAALLKTFATRFGDMPIMETRAIGYGMGKKDFEMANCVRVMLGETGLGTDTICELSCNVDDMTAESIGFAMECLLEGGAMEVFTVPVGMKKNRPGTLINVICREPQRDEMVRLLFLHTSTLGIRESVKHRFILDRRLEQVETPYGLIQRKVSSGYGTSKVKYEYDDLARIARENHISLEEIRSKL